MTNLVDSLFRPLAVKRLELANRIVMAPMTRNFSPGGVPGEDVAAYYRRRAENGCGLIITEGATIASPVAAGHPNVPFFWGQRACAGWRSVVTAVHDAGGKIIPQLWHVGMQRDAATSDDPSLPSLGPSGIDRQFRQAADPMTRRQIRDIVDVYAEGARTAKALGFDGIEVHAAHGYLVDQFFWHRTNLRADAYGGTIENRVRFGAEIAAAMRQEVGPDFPILFRISQWKGHDYDARLAETPQELECFLRPLVDAGVDMFHCSQRRFWEPEFAGSTLNLAGWAKKLTGRPSITVGSVSLSGEFLDAVIRGQGAGIASIEHLLERLERDEFDLVAVGRALLADPAWPRKIREARRAELIAFSKDHLESLT
jgi:2,4-dienoyl-CoA reductase-like NADH-dependent reductase (Old Yellow Enzyme family)